MTFAPVTAQQDTPARSTGVLRGGPLVAGVEVSVVTGEAHTITAQATKQSIESGAEVTDHVIIVPPSVAITYEVANTGDGPNVAKDVFETFKTMLEKRELMELITEHYVYDNMVLVSLTPLHAAPYKGRLQCTATLQRVNQVKIAVVGRDPKNLGKGSTQKTAAAQTNAGTQNGKPVRQSYAEKIRQKSLGNQ